MEKPSYGGSGKIAYFKYCGEVNTERVLRAAKVRCEETHIEKMIIASETGRSAIKALEVFKETNVKIIVVTHYPAETWGPKGNIPIGLRRKEYEENLEENRCKIIQGTRPFAPLRVPPIGDIPLRKASLTKPLKFLGQALK